MPLTNTQLRYYDSQVLRLPADKRKEYHEQVDNLIAELNRTLKDKTEIKVTRVVKAGSFAKYTILRRTAVDPIDVDTVFYVSGRSVDNETLGTLSDKIHELLIGIYPTKDVKDFEIQRKAATVTFVRSGLAVDVVPVIEEEGNAGYGWQYDIHGGSTMRTCAPCQLKFVRDRKTVDGDFRTLVRLMKKWRNHVGLKPLKSFLIELIVAHVLEVQGKHGTVEQRFRNILLYIAQSGLKERIYFAENDAPYTPFSDPVVILDPVCSKNNVASRITEAERLEIVATAQQAWEQAYFASVEDDVDLWKELFGPRFKVED